MTKKPLYVERRDDGRYAVEKKNAQRASAVFDTQREAKIWAKAHTDGPVHVERVRRTKAGTPDKWQS